MKPTTLSKPEIKAILKQIPEHAAQAQRLVEYLANNPKMPTVSVNANCAIGNISHVAAKTNPILFKHGLFISCERPAAPIPNRFGERSQMFEWSIFRLENNGDPANDGQEQSKVTNL